MNRDNLVITRFAPSPTGFLHIGGARTALFNWLFARHYGGKFLLRIEDTDKERSTEEAKSAIFEGMNWLGLDYDGEVIYQSKRADRHVEIANQLLDSGHAYKCYCTKEELDSMRERAIREKRPPKYERVCREDSSSGKGDVNVGRGSYVVRFKTPIEGETTIDDGVQGKVTIKNEQLDDLILLRADGSPTYMLSVVVDDHDMGVTHIIRGDDHLTNSFRQLQIYNALGWDVPKFFHVPLIHGQDGAKLSKRHGALGVMEYAKMGFLPETINNYLLRLGWSHGDDEIISMKQAIEWFDGSNLGKAACRLDMVKMTNLNGIYIRQADNERLLKIITPIIEGQLGLTLSEAQVDRVLRGMDGLKQRAKTTVELAESAQVYVVDVPDIGRMDDKAVKNLQPEHIDIIKSVLPFVENISDDDWSHDKIETVIRSAADSIGLKLGKVAQPMRCALTGRAVSPGLFDVMEVLGKQETIRRIEKIL